MKLELHINDLFDLDRWMFILYNEVYISGKSSVAWDRFSYAISSQSVLHPKINISGYKSSFIY